ncbi:2Fe-2S iron-sulfur cluster binding domain-containing protein [Allopusillimonas soli]|uniref:2Fe-2S iron-sulfur cluster binding domain-containing protein n=1 Tax=Allopusillimonas soli TaxID=659016 RepID=A0A853FC52_9BURK|nr:2Fe-2S iron-sulfur cluster-binding protein [Allopusillimonas soli]NYT37653.1 2Fe-2S iron-sulfur cluster binding domain-containing protein [Allopusillimonas soli]TEA74387.1 2Fe-2S iron-sulfur cluster binding domain-containing protein [Allopusillimonas soli]
MELLIQPLNRMLHVSPGANLLDVLRENQVPISYSCMAGRCGTCRCRIVEGEVLESGQEELRPLSGQAQYVFACQTWLTESCVIEIPEPDEIIVHPARILKASVIAVESLAPDIRRLRLKPGKPLQYSPGQYANLQFAAGMVRPYSMAGTCEDDELEFHVRIVPGGRAGNHIAAGLRPGDAVRVSGPLGSAYLRCRHEGPMLCVAGGTGLAPVLSIVRGALAAGMRNPIHLYLGVRSSRDLYGMQWLAPLQRDHGNLHVQIVANDSKGISEARRGLVTEAIAEDWRDLTGWRAYLCGSPPMVEATSLLVRQRGIRLEHVHADAFYAAST